MVNLAVGYQRPNNALLTLRDEVYARYGKPARLAEFVTGYKSASNLTGHNADSNGVCHAVDLFFSNNSVWTEDRGWELAEWLRTVEGPKGSIPGYPDRMYYIIYRDRIAGDFSGWEWVGSGYAHWDHIHVSTCDMYWGDPAPIPPGDYDSNAPWGFSSGELTPSGNITPIEEDDMGFVDDLSDEAAAKIARHVHDLQVEREGGGTNTLRWSLSAEGQRTERIIAGTAEATARLILNTAIARGGGSVGGESSLAGVVAYFDQNRADILSAVGKPSEALAGLDAEQVNAAIKAGLDAALAGTQAVITFGGES